MDVYNVILQAVGSLGFPIVACAAMFWKVNEQDKAHKEQMDKLSEAVANNTKAIIALTEKLDK